MATLGSDYWRYGVASNEPALEAFLRYHHTQGLSAKKMSISDLFTPSATEQFII